MNESKVGRLLRHLREESNLSLRTLAERTGFSAAFLSQVENGQASPSISSMEKIALSLGLSLWQFFQQAEDERTAVVRSDSRPGLESKWSKAHVAFLSHGDVHSKLEPVLITLQPNGSSGKRPHAQPNEEFAFVLAGVVALTLGEEEHELRQGDAVTIQAGALRRWFNPGEQPAEILIVSAGSKFVRK